MYFEEENQPNEVLGCHKIIQACSHFPDIVNLDLKAHYLTIHLRKGWHVAIEDIVFRKISHALTKCGFVSDCLTPGLILDHDRAGSRYGFITNDSPHLHGLLFTPDQLSYGDRLRLNWVIDLTLAGLRDIDSSTTQIYIPTEPLGMVADYNGKLAKLKSQEGTVDSLQGKIYPIDRVRSDERMGTVKYLRWMDRSDEKLSSFYADPLQFFSSAYNQKFKQTMGELAEFGKKQSWFCENVINCNAAGKVSKPLYKSKEGRHGHSSDAARRRFRGRPIGAQRKLRSTIWWQRQSTRGMVSFRTIKAKSALLG